MRTRTQFLWCPAAHVDGLGELQDTSILLFVFQPPPLLPPLPVSALSATTLCFSARRAGVLRSLKACTALWRHALTRIFPRPAVPPTRICFLLCCQVAPLPSVDPLHFGDLPPRLPWDPTTLFRAPAPATPQHTTDSSMCQGSPLSLSFSFHLSVSFTNTLSPFSLSPLSYSVFHVRRCVAHSHNLPHVRMPRLIHHCRWPPVCGISRMSKQRSPSTRVTENRRHMLCGWTNKRHWPHDHRNHRHDDLVEDVEEVAHDLPPLAHPAHADAEGDEEANQAFEEDTEQSVTEQSVEVHDAKQQISPPSATHRGRSCPICTPVTSCSPWWAQFGSVPRPEPFSAPSEPGGRKQNNIQTDV